MFVAKIYITACYLYGIYYLCGMGVGHLVLSGHMRKVIRWPLHTGMTIKNLTWKSVYLGWVWNQISCLLSQFHFAETSFPRWDAVLSWRFVLSIAIATENFCPYWALLKLSLHVDEMPQNRTGFLYEAKLKRFRHRRDQNQLRNKGCLKEKPVNPSFLAWY